jgi:hypothetical protein
MKYFWVRVKVYGLTCGDRKGKKNHGHKNLSPFSKRNWWNSNMTISRQDRMFKQAQQKAQAKKCFSPGCWK